MFLPLHDANAIRHIRFPYVNYGLIGLTTLCFLLQAVLPQAAFDQATINFGMIPIVVRDVYPQPVPWLPDWATLVTYQFLHMDWLHLLSNMLFLWIFGDNVEDRMGHGRYLAFYLLCGIVAVGAQVLAEPLSSVPMVGASGAIAGVLGAYIVMFPGNRVTVFVFRFLTQVPAVAAIGIWALLQFINGFGSVAVSQETGGVAYMAHIGGFLAGLVAGLLFRTIFNEPRRPRGAPASAYG